MFHIFPMLMSSLTVVRATIAAERAAIHAKHQHNQADAGNVIDVEARFLDDAPALPNPITSRAQA